MTDVMKAQGAKSKARVINTKQVVSHSALGLAGDADRLAGKIGRIMRGDPRSETLTAEVKDEMACVLRRLEALAEGLGLDFEDIADETLKSGKHRRTRSRKTRQ